MCPSVTVVPAGNPLSVALKVTLAVCTLPDESFVTNIVIDTLPVPDDSALVMGGTSLDGNSVAVKTGLGAAVLPEGDVDDEPQPAATNASATINAATRVMSSTSCSQ